MDSEKQTLKEALVGERFHNEPLHENIWVTQIGNAAWPNSKYINVHSYWRWIFITVFILSKVFLLLAIYFYIKCQNIELENKKIKYQIELQNR